ncbi:MAG: M48 family metalloprotease [Thermoplasmata archaeon]
MASPSAWVIVIPVASWLALGVGLLVAVRRSDSPIVLRLAAVFLGVWSLLATTALVAVVLAAERHQLPGEVLSTGGLFSPAEAELWALGALGALGVLALAFGLNQIVARGLLHLGHPQTLRWPPALGPAPPSLRLVSFASPRIEAFSFTLLEVGGSRGIRRTEIIFVSEASRHRLTDDEQVAVIAHEWGHIRGLDSRYLTFFRTLARMMRWDPVVGYCASSLTRREEYRADREAARLTGRPEVLARALWKAATFSTPDLGRGYGGFTGRGVRGRRSEVVRRIERLLPRAEVPRDPGGSGGR